MRSAVCHANCGVPRTSDARSSQKSRLRLKCDGVATVTALCLMFAIRDDIVTAHSRMSKAEVKPWSVYRSDYASMAHVLQTRAPRQRELRHSGIVNGSTVFQPTFREARSSQKSA